MPTTYLVLMDPESAVESACDAILTAASIATTKSRETDALAGTRVDIMATMTSGHTDTQRPTFGGGTSYVAWSGQITFRIFTPADNSSAHATTRAKIRERMQYRYGAFTTDNLPYHQVIRIKESGCTQVVEEDQLHGSELSYDVVVGIRETGWPVS